MVCSLFGLLEYRLDLLSLFLGVGDVSDVLFRARLFICAMQYASSSLPPSTATSTSAAASTRLRSSLADFECLSPALIFSNYSLCQRSTPLAPARLRRLVDPLLTYERHRVCLAVLLGERCLFLYVHLVVVSPLIQLFRELGVDLATCDSVEVDGVHIRGHRQVIIGEDGGRATKGTRRVAARLPRAEGLVSEGDLALVLRIDIFFFEAPVEISLLASESERSVHRNVRKLTFLLTLRRQRLRFLHARHGPTYCSACPRLRTRRSPDAALTHSRLRIAIILHRSIHLYYIGISVEMSTALLLRILIIENLKQIK